ncbi:DctP family TRAP transporter solute-binding subunit [Candidatus Magnetobacterium casense]|uniref:DctP family TRAP transporter solute-binding subunit n=1 Tax=Candidatus Magnetobacterium casense TaxID=1455061 RepID=A0ABS6S2B4_9BACT|nr:DctP family TRAP transporter solute-binding subunit [Candidatus Magnetobacterium casensis]MBV6342971.1 DctP family TRAP transporter solute-binding subunit [Candidatus Magnetobacterium casensis]
MKDINRRLIFVVTAVIGMALAMLLYLYLFATSNSVGKEAKVYELTFGHNMPPDSAMHTAAQRFSDTVSERTKGRVKIKIFPVQQLANDHQMIEMAIDGQLDILLSPTAKLSMILPSLQYADIPFLFPHTEDAYAMLDGKPGALLLERLREHGLVGAAFWGNGFKQFTADRPIRSPKDFNGMNIRIMKSNLIMDQFLAFGANPIPIDFHQTYKALKDGVVDGHENPIAAIYALKFYEVQSHLIISNHAYLAYVFCFSKKTLDSLPEDIVRIVMTTAKEFTTFERELIAKKEAEHIKVIREAGVDVSYLSEQQSKEFQRTTRHIVDKYAAIVGEDVIGLTREYLSHKYNYTQEEDIIIGLNADMSMGSSLTGMSIKRGMELAINEINAHGGVLGKQLSVVVMDHTGMPAISKKNIASLSKMKNLVAIMGGLHSSVVLADLEMIHKEKIIYLIPWAASDNVTNNQYKPNYVFRVSANDAEAGHFLVRQALKKSKKIAILSLNTLWGRENERVLVDYLKDNNLTPCAIESFNVGEENMLKQIANIEASGAEVLVLIATAPEGAAIVKGLVLRQQKMPIIAHGSITGGYFWTDAKEQLKHVDLTFFQTFSFLNPKNETTKRVLNNYMTTYHVSSPQEIPAPAATAQAYDLVHLLAMAINNAKTIDRPSIRNALENIQHYNGMIKTYSPPFTKTRHDALNVNDYFMATYDADGAIVPIGKETK